MRQNTLHAVKSRTRKQNAIAKSGSIADINRFNSYPLLAYEFIKLTANQNIEQYIIFAYFVL